MNEISSKYNPQEVENKWYAYWLENNVFHSEIDETKTPYTIVIPPPNVTGILHMGHMLNNTIQDVLARRSKMLGFNTCWIPGTDHASIATEAKVVAKLKENGIEKQDLTREEFLQHAWEWKEKHGGIILEQLKKLGCSCDWQRTRFTMEEALYESVISVFVDLYNKGLIYRGVRMVNWDPKALTALSDEEVIFKEQKSKLYYLKYMIEGSQTGEYVVVATTRPETIMGDTAVCVNPTDERYNHLKGKRLVIPIVNRAIDVIFDEYVDKEFGTGALKITPAHDLNDYNLGLKYGLESINIFNDNATLNEYGLQYAGLDRFECRRKIVKDLEETGLMERIEDYTNKIGCSERTDAVIEPKLSLQWFLRMEDLAKPALEVVMSDEIRFYPSKFKNTYKHWMENVKDWCISRQLWWGQRIPAYYLPNREFVVAKTKEEAFEMAKAKFPDVIHSIEDLKQDDDVLDTWFSSWLWPISVFDGIRYPQNEEIMYYYPTDDLVTAPEIIFFWVARMIMAGLEYRKEIPFKNVYFTGIVRDKLGRKMSKSLGNSPDPIMLIEKYGADGVRMGMLMASPAGNDLPFDEAYCEQGRNFANKIWNALRLVKGWTTDDNEASQHQNDNIACQWIEEKFNNLLLELEDAFSKYRLSEAMMQIYKFVWDDFCSWFLEAVKPEYGKPVSKITYLKTLSLFEKIMQVLHPFMPFLTEEIWHLLRNNAANETIMQSEMPKAKTETNSQLLQDFIQMQEIVIAVRAIRNEKNISPKAALPLFIKGDVSGTLTNQYAALISKFANLSEIKPVFNAVEGSVTKLVGSLELFIPLGDNINKEDEQRKLEEEITYLKGFMASVEKKLSNESFVAKAPQSVVEGERKKFADAKEKIQTLQSRLSQLR
ncbi:MAG: valine--tRNA ligase [Bacteroidales bacterium]|jgi:valyl-tRNA synthetase|nr:valine--tRNA ligase [Bacteroidales bacterium]